MITSIDLPKEIFAIDMLRALKSLLEHHRKHVLRLLQRNGDQASVRITGAIKRQCFSRGNACFQ